MIQTTVHDAAASLRDLVEAALRGEDVLIMLEEGERVEVVRLVAVPEVGIPPRREPGSAKGLFWIADDFDEPLEELDEYTR